MKLQGRQVLPGIAVVRAEVGEFDDAGLEHELEQQANDQESSKL